MILTVDLFNLQISTLAPVTGVLCSGFSCVCCGEQLRVADAEPLGSADSTDISVLTPVSRASVHHRLHKVT